MLYLPELLVQVTAHTLGWRVGVGHLRMTGFQILQLVHHEVEFLVADGRLIQHVITVVMLVQLFPQLLYAFDFIHSLQLFACKGTKKK